MYNQDQLDNIKKGIDSLQDEGQKNILNEAINDMDNGKIPDLSSMFSKLGCPAEMQTSLDELKNLEKLGKSIMKKRK